MEVSTIPMESLFEILDLQMSSGGTARLVVTGNSMYPTLRHRKDVVYLEPLTRQLKKGDLILYKRTNGQYVLHRIVSKPKNDGFICSGDNQWEKEPVAADQVIAVTNGFLRNGKKYANTALSYRMWVSLWLFLFPVRRPLLTLRRWIGRLRRK